MTTRSPKFKPDDLVRVRTHPEVLLVVVRYEDKQDEKGPLLVRCMTYDKKDGCERYKPLPECLLESATSSSNESFVDRSQCHPDVVRVHLTGTETQKAALHTLSEQLKPSKKMDLSISDLSPGDRVYLKGVQCPQMVYFGKVKRGSWMYAKTIWFDDAEQKTGEFPLNSLTRMSPMEQALHLAVSRRCGVGA